jgi:FSR family fosmidomycin resistance protein-like MFS transporter
MNDRNKLVLLQYATAHGLVDLSCATALFGLWYVWSPSMNLMVSAILLYGILAFGTQPLFGWLSDRFAAPRLMAVCGCMLTAAGIVVMPVSFWLTVVLIGLGNALFHVGGGSIALDLTPYKAMSPGLFVAPGAIGLTLGTLLGRSGFAHVWIFAVALVATALVLYILKSPPHIKTVVSSSKNTLWLVALTLVLLVILGRSLIGFAWVLPWKSNLALLMIMTLAVSAGKGAGGLLADKFGFLFIALFGVVVSAPLIIIFPGVPLLAIAGVCLFQFTMPVTLAATYRLLPDRPGLAFGLPCLALIIGAIPILIQRQIYFSGTYFLFISFVLISIITFFALKLTPGTGYNVPG